MLRIVQIITRNGGIKDTSILYVLFHDQVVYEINVLFKVRTTKLVLFHSVKYSIIKI